jgi:hypothetical protein
MSNQNSKIDNILAAIEKEFPNEAERLAVVAFVNWHNILNHAALEKFEEKQVLYACLLILELASDNFKLSNANTINQVSLMKKISLDESIEFLNEEDSDEDS